MKRNILFIYSCLSLNFFICSGFIVTPHSLAPGKGQKITIENKSYQDIWNAAFKAVSDKASLVDSKKDLGEIRAKKDSGLFIADLAIVIFIRPPLDDHNLYQIEVVSGQINKLIHYRNAKMEETIIEAVKHYLKVK